MFGWLTRNDGARMARARRRLKSPRGSVFTEFALVMPIVVMVCSALIEVVGFWDAQVMANHTAWTVGRIAMVRGSDGMAFSENLDQKSKTGIAGSSMPGPIKAALADLDSVIHGANLFNNRGNITAMFLMSTCGIGYFGKSPGATLSDLFDRILNDGMDALTKGIPEWISELTKVDFNIPIDLGGGEGINKIVNDLISTVVNKIMEAVIGPLANVLKDMLQAMFDALFGEGGSKIDDLFHGDGVAAYRARQMFGAAQRIVRAKSVAGKEVLTVTDLDKSRTYLFTADKALSDHGRLVYPQVADKEVSSDGYMVKGAHGWPPNANGLAMVHVEINWPYESGWLFPALSGRTAPKVAPPLARGHSMVFPQPDIANDNLYSEGATAFKPGDYEANEDIKAMEELANEMKDYLRGVRFCMKYRICEDTVTLHDGNWSWATFTDWKDCPELMEALCIKNIPAPDDCDYLKSWEKLTGSSDQRPTRKSIEDRFEASSYRYSEYLFWDEAWRKRYGTSICYARGDSTLGQFYNNQPWLTYANSSRNALNCQRKHFDIIYRRCLEKMSKEDRDWMTKKYGNGLDDHRLSDFDRYIQKRQDLYDKMVDFANRNKVNVPNIVKWMDGQDLATWKEQDAALSKAANAADGSFDLLQKLLRKEIKEMDDIIAGSAQYKGSEEDPVFDPEDGDAMQDPKKAVDSAREKWKKLKEALRAKLAEIEKAAGELRREWANYKDMALRLVSSRQNCVGDHFVVGCINTIAKTRNAALFDNDSSFRFPAGCFPYDIGKGTRDLLAEIARYQTAVNTSYQLEEDYGVLLGLRSASESKRKGLTPDQMIDSGELPSEDSGGTLTPGDDKGEIIEKDRQEYSGGKWNWR